MSPRLVFVILLLAARALHAEVGPVGQWLMNTPASLFQVGLMRLHQEVATLDVDTETEKRSVTADYDLDNNAIVIQASVHRLGDDTEEALKNTCEATIGAIRKHGGVAPRTGEYMGASSLYASLFQPQGSPRENEPKDWRQRLDEIILVRVGVISSTSPSKIVQCEGPFASNEISYQD